MNDKSKTIATSDLHNCAAVLQVQAETAEKRGHHARAETLMRGFELLFDLAGREYDTVTVPRELLRQVLKLAKEDSNFLTINGFWDDVSLSEPMRARHVSRIEELRRVAGMEEEHD